MKKMIITEQQLFRIIEATNKETPQEDDNIDGVFQQDRFGAQYTLNDIKIYFRVGKKGILDFMGDDGIIIRKDKTGMEISDFIYKALLAAKEHGFNQIINLEIPMGSDYEDKELFKYFMAGNRMYVTRGRKGLNVRLEDSGLSSDNPFSIQRVTPIKGSSMRRYLEAFHGTVQPEGVFDLNNPKLFENGFHVGTYKAATERVGLSYGNAISGLGRLVNMEQEPRIYRVIVDTSNIANMDNPINDHVVFEFMKKHKNDYDGVAYINKGEDVGSVSLSIWNKNAIVNFELFKL